MNILVIGSKGQLGLKIKDSVKKLRGFKYEFTDIDKLDITNYNAVKSKLKEKQYFAVINCAAYTAVDLAEKEQEQAAEINSNSPGNLAAACKSSNSLFIHVSTDYVFDGNGNVPYHEDSPTNPTSVYGKTKLEGERLVLKNNDKSIVIRTCWLYSEYGNNFVKTIIRLSQERDMLKVVCDQTGTPTYAGDLAEIIVEIVSKAAATGLWKPGLYHYSNSGVCSWYDFAVEILKLCKKNTQVKPVLSNEFPQIAKRPAYSVLDKSKIMSVYDINIPYWRDSLAKMIKKYLAKNKIVNSEI